MNIPISRVVLTALLLFWFVAAASALEVELKETAAVLGSQVTLGDLAELDAGDDPDGKLAALELFPAPAVGQKNLVRAEEVARRLAPWAATTGPVTLTGAAAVTVVRDGLTIDADMVERLLEHYLLSQQDRLPNAEVRFKSITPIRPLVVPMGQLSHEIIPSDSQLLRSRRFTILFRIDGKVVQNVAVRAELEAIAPVVVAAADLARGVVLTAQDLKLAELDLGTVRNPCFDLEELVGQKITRPVRLGTPFDRNMVELPAVIKRGELVTIRIRQAGLQLTAKGEALKDGRAGESIRVRNSSSNKDILCRVVAPGLVEVEY